MKTTKQIVKDFGELRRDIMSGEPTAENNRDWAERLADLCEDLAARLQGLEAHVERATLPLV